VLTFHSVDDASGALSYAPADFEALLATLAAARLPIIDLDTLLAEGTTHGVALTFDDGMRSVLDVAFPIWPQNGAPPLLSSSPGPIGGSPTAPGAYGRLTGDRSLASPGTAL